MNTIESLKAMQKIYRESITDDPKYWGDAMINLGMTLDDAIAQAEKEQANKAGLHKVRLEVVMVVKIPEKMHGKDARKTNDFLNDALENLSCSFKSDDMTITKTDLMGYEHEPVR